MHILNNEGVRSALRLAAKKWAYICGTVLTVMIFIVLFISFFVPWYSNHLDGNFWIPPQSYPSNSTQTPDLLWVRDQFYMHEYLFHVEFTDFQGLTLNCKYSDGTDCSDLKTWQYYFPKLVSWDLTQYSPTYGAIFTFIILSIIMAFILGVYLQVVLWKAEEWSLRVRKILTGVGIGLCLTLFVFLLITWTIIMGHQKVVQQAVGNGYTQAWCNTLIYRPRGGLMCNWLGKNAIEDYTNADKQTTVNKIPEWFLGCEVSNFTEWYYPDGGWVCCMLALGFSLWILLLVVGWHPTFES